MRMITRSFGLFALVFFLVTVASVAADDKGDKKSKSASLLTPIGVLEGEILHVDEDGERIILRTKQLKQVLVNNPNAGVANRLNNISVFGRIGASNPNNVTVGVKEENKDYKLVAAPDMKIRLFQGKNEPSQGKAKKKASESKDKDPDSKLGGTAGKKENLAKGQLVRIQVGRSKDSINQQNYAMVVLVLSEGK